MPYSQEHLTVHPAHLLFFLPRLPASQLPQCRDSSYKNSARNATAVLKDGIRNSSSAGATPGESSRTLRARRKKHAVLLWRADPMTVHLGCDRNRRTESPPIFFPSSKHLSRTRTAEPDRCETCSRRSCTIFSLSPSGLPWHRNHNLCYDDHTADANAHLQNRRSSKSLSVTKPERISRRAQHPAEGASGTGPAEGSS